MFSAACSNRIRRIITGALAIILLNGILASILPLETLASGQMCTLACCAGQPSHAAGSCMDGSCHAVFTRTDHNHRSQGERDEEYQFGVTLPVRGWTIDTDYFHTRVKNFFDHDALGNSNIFFPLTIERVFISALEVTARSPMLFKRAQFHLAYSHQKIQGQGAVTGGLTDFSPPADLFFLDHDQRHTLSTGLIGNLPLRGYVSGNVLYGSGFLKGDGPDHLPGHMTFDFSVGKRFGEDWAVAFHSVNVTNKRFLLDSANTFGGTHFNEARQIYVELRYRFHY